MGENIRSQTDDDLRTESTNSLEMKEDNGHGEWVQVDHSEVEATNEMGEEESTTGGEKDRNSCAIQSLEENDEDDKEEEEEEEEEDMDPKIVEVMILHCCGWQSSDALKLFLYSITYNELKKVEMLCWAWNAMIVEHIHDGGMSTKISNVEYCFQCCAESFCFD